jgi:hypothetical protein
LRVRVIELIYHRSLYRSPRLDLAGEIGIHHLTLAAGLEARVAVDGTALAGEIEGRASAGEPLPLLGAAAEYRIASALRARAEARALDASINGINGRLIEWRAGLDWQPARHWSLGFYYSRFDLTLELERARWRGTLDFRYRGPQVAFTTYW